MPVMYSRFRLRLNVRRGVRETTNFTQTLLEVLQCPLCAASLTSFYNVVLHQMDFLEDPAITNVILLPVILQEVCVLLL